MRLPPYLISGAFFLLMSCWRQARRVNWGRVVYFWYCGNRTSGTLGRYLLCPVDSEGGPTLPGRCLRLESTSSILQGWDSVEAGSVDTDHHALQCLNRASPGRYFSAF